MREEYNKVINKSTGELTKLDVDALTTIPRLLKLLLKMSEILSKKVKIDTVEKRHKDLSKLNKEYICEYERFNKDVMLGKFERKYKVIRRERREEGINIVNEMKFLRYLSVFFNSRMSSRVVTDNGFEEYLLRIKVKDGSLFDYLKTSNSSLSLEVRMNCLKKEKEDIMYLKNEYDSIFVLNSDNNMCILNLEKMLRSMVGNKEILEDIDERLKGKYEKRLKFEGELEKLGSSALNVLKIEEKIRNISKLKDILNYDCSGMADVLEEKTIKKEENGYIKDFSTEGYLRRKRACFGKMLADKKRKKYNVWDVDNSNLDKGFGFVGNWKWGT
jgi:hypothetical protein